MDKKPAAEKEKQPTNPREGWEVRYPRARFPFEERSISEADWARAGLLDPDPPQDQPRKPRDGVRAVTWNKANGWRVPATELDFLDDDEWTRFIEADPDLEVVKGE
jgi:hypothetical protein